LRNQGEAGQRAMCEKLDREREPAHLEARYANYFKAGFNSEEVVIDLGQGYGRDENKVRIHTRIVTLPAYARALAELLQGTVEDYEGEYGKFGKPARRSETKIKKPPEQANRKP